MRFSLIFATTMFLAQALNSLKYFECNGDRQVLAKVLKNPEKLAKTLLRIEFLTACRRNKVSPRFIDDAMKPIGKIFGDRHSVISKCKKLSSALLNEAISEAFKTKAFLIRQRDRLDSAVADFLTENRLAQVRETCERVFDATIRENRPRLLKKFYVLLNRTASIPNDEDEVRGCNKTAVPKQQSKLNNLSSLELGDTTVKLLSKGPNFALTQQISSDVVLEAEKGVERLAYGKRWKDAITGWRLPIITRTGSFGTDTENGPSGPASVNTGRAEDGPSARAPAPPAPKTAGATGNEETSTGTETSRRGTSGDRGPTIVAAGTGTMDVDTGEAAAAAATTAQRTSRPLGLSFRFSDTDTRFPPPSSVEVERKLKKLKDEVIKTYKNHKVVKNNVSEDERQFLSTLKKNDDVVIKQSDKCKGFVIMNKSAYLDKAQDILGDRNNYETVDKNPVPKVEAQTKRIFKSVSKNKLPESVIKELTPNHSRTPVFYGLPKDHKPSVPLRPVISGCDGPTRKTSCLLERILKQLLKFVPTHLWNTRDFLERMNSHKEKHGIPEGAIFFSIDVINLYGSIPVGEAIISVMEKLKTHLHEVDTFGLTLDDIQALLTQCLNENVFSFGNQHYRQKLGIAMGNPCAPPIAILFLDKLERQTLENISKKPKFLVRYIDDYAGLWIHGEKALLEFLAHMNTVHDTVKFTIEHSGQGQGVPFLDTLVTIEAHGDRTTIETELYIKPTNSGIILHYHSAHPTQTKHNMARNQFDRALRNSSSASKEENSIGKIWALLAENGYPRHIISRLLEEARRGRRQTTAHKNDVHSDGFLCLPYIDEQLLCKIKSKVKKSGLDVKIAWQNKEKLKNLLVRSSLCKPKCPGGPRCHTCKTGFMGDCTVKNVVYEIRCDICKEMNKEGIYIGETKRPLRLRFNEHVRDMLNKTQDSPMGDHFREHHGEVTHGSSIPLKIKVLYKSKDHPDRKIVESLIIRKNRPQLNSNVSSWPIL